MLVRSPDLMMFSRINKIILTNFISVPEPPIIRVTTLIYKSDFESFYEYDTITTLSIGHANELSLLDEKWWLKYMRIKTKFDLRQKLFNMDKI